MKLLKTAIENQHWDVAAHALVIGMIEAKRAEGSARPVGRKDNNGKKRRSVRKPKSS